MDTKQKEIAQFLRKSLVESLHLPMAEKDISFDAPLFGEEVGLDSVDSLELIAIIANEYEIRMNAQHKEHFFSLTTLSAYIAKTLAEKEVVSA